MKEGEGRADEVEIVKALSIWARFILGLALTDRTPALLLYSLIAICIRRI